jgi:Tol biopolymer transport system component
MRSLRWFILVVAVCICACRFSANPARVDPSSDKSDNLSTSVPKTLSGTIMPGLSKSTLPPEEQVQATAMIVPTGDLPPIAFSAHGWCIKNSGEEIFLINPDGSGIFCATKSVGDDQDPSWSPDGTRIVFKSNRTGTWQVFVMDANGENQTQVTNAPNGIEYPDWTADGSGILYSYLEERGSSIHRIDVDGSNDQVILASDDGCANRYPNASTDGQWITISRFGGEGKSGIWAMRTDGSNLHLVVSGPLHYPAWSPDGNRIAFDGEPGGNQFDIYLINPDGSDMKGLPFRPENFSGYNKKPSWSPDGSQIVFSTQLDMENTELFELFIMDADGTNIHRVTHLDGDYSLYTGCYHPDWNPAAGE